MSGNRTGKGARPAAAVIPAIVMVSLLTLKPAATHLTGAGVAEWVRELIAMSRGRDLSVDTSFQFQPAGYYERLIHGSSEDVPFVERLFSKDGSLPPIDDYYDRDGLLLYKLKRNVNANTLYGPLFTNADGLADRNYTKARADGVRRIALLGDSLSRGYGVPMSERFEALFEERLNAETHEQHGNHLEVIDFAVGGYRATQMLDVAMQQVPAFHPDLYLITLTPLGVGPKWGEHLYQLSRNGIDPPFGFLRQAMVDSGLRSSDPPETAQWKLAPYRLKVLGEILRTLKASAERQGAKLLVVLLPAAETPEITRLRFLGIREMVNSAGVPVIDLLDTFDQVTDIETMRLAWHDIHYNPTAHRMIADALYLKFHAEPAGWATLAAASGKIRHILNSTR